MVRTLFALGADTPSGKPVAVPIPVAPVVLNVISVMAEFIATDCMDSLSQLYSYAFFHFSTINIFVPSLLNAIPCGLLSSSR